MRQLKFLILALGMLVANGVLAVTLPTTSYTPTVEDVNGDGLTLYTGVQYTGSFHSLGEGECSKSSAASSYGTNCSGCCENLYSTDINNCYNNCTGSDDECDEQCMGPSTAYGTCVTNCKGGDVDPLAPLDDNNLILILMCVMAMGIALLKYNKKVAL